LALPGILIPDGYNYLIIVDFFGKMKLISANWTIVNILYLFLPGGYNEIYG